MPAAARTRASFPSPFVLRRSNSIARTLLDIQPPQPMQATTETGRQAGEPRAAPQNPAPAYRLPVEEVLVRLQADARHGLSAGEANARLREYGPNELAEEKPVPQWRKFLAQFQNVLVLLLLVATAISAGLWLYERESALPYEAMAIFAVVLLNAAMGYIQESRAEEAVAALRQMSAARANVVREGIRRSLPRVPISSYCRSFACAETASGFAPDIHPFSSILSRS